MAFNEAKKLSEGLDFVLADYWYFGSMIKVQYASDLHLEFVQNRAFLRKYPLRPSGDVLILAGDIAPIHELQKYGEFFDLWADQFRMVYWLPGNHEYYHGDLGRHAGSFVEQVRSNVILLNNQIWEEGPLRLVFSTLWSRIDPRNAFALQTNLNDFHLIRYQQKRFTPDHYHQQHTLAKQFLQGALAQQPWLGLTVVITHHVPTFQHYPPQYKGDILNEAFASHLDELVFDCGADYWIYGHHHRNIPEFCIGQTRLVTNQLGYVQYEEHWSFQHQQVLTLAEPEL